MLNLNPITLSQVVDEAMRAAADHPRWLTAISRAVVELLSNPYLHRQEDHSLLIASSSSERIYSANGVCQCQAFAHNQPCWHRAAARLVRRHDEAQARHDVDEQRMRDELADGDRWAQAQREMDEVFGIGAD